MNRTYLSICLLFAAILFADCSRTHQGNQQNRRDSTFSSEIAEASFDTLSALNLLALSKEDSTLLHLDTTMHDLEFPPVDEIRKLFLSPTDPPFYIRSTISVYTRSDQMQSFGSYVVMYAATSEHESVNKIREVSIAVPVGPLEGFDQSLKVVDINHDGFKDLVVSFVQNTNGNDGVNFFWVFNRADRRFHVDSALNLMFHDECIHFRDNAMEISTGGRMGSLEYSGQVYHWTGAKYELYAEETTEHSGAAIIETRKELVNGQWRVVRSDTVH